VRITRLELFGFKSFCDRTSFTFGEGISCVVGPNGSGKSNVVDALKWVIGEQSARSLRGAEMQDVIFAGSVDRKPVGFAEVQLTLCADEGEPFPGEYAALREVQVGRRLHRSGASEYLINQVKCRRRDVVDLFLDTGIGTNLYSFIEQGRVDKVVSASPPERRELIDEAAGISRYKQRRGEARKRLESTVQQLDRAADVADEMARRLGVLERQVLKAARFRRLRARVRQRETYLALVKYRGLAADRRALQRSLREGRREEAAARRGLLRREEDLRLRREETASVEQAATSWRDEVAEHDAVLRELASQITLQSQRAEELREQGATAARDAEEAEAAVRALQGELDGARQALAETEATLAARGATTAERQQALASARTARQAAEAAAEERRRAVGEARAALAAVEARHAELRRVVERRGGEDDESAAASSELQRRAAALEAARDEAVASLEARGGALASAESALATAEAELAEAVARRDAARQAAEARVTAAMERAASVRRDLQAIEAQVATARKERAAARRVAAAERRRARDQQAAAVHARGSRWVDAVAARGRSQVERAARRGDERLAEVEAAATHDEAAARSDARQRVDEAMASTDTRIRDALRPLRQAAARARRHLDEVRAERAECQRRLADLSAREAALQARLATTDDDMTLPASLVDRLEPAAAEDALIRLGRRAGLPMVTAPEELQAVIDALPEDRDVQVWWRSDLPDPPERTDGVADAVGAALASGRAVVVEGRGVRVEPDGVVTVTKGQPPTSAAARVRWRASLEEVAEDRALAETSAADLTEAEERAESSLEEAEQRLADAEREAERARRRARSEAEAEAARQVDEAVARGREARDAASLARDEAVRAARRRAEEALEAVRARREACERDLVAALDAALEGEEQLEASAEEALVASEDERSRAASQALDEALEAVAEARAGSDVSADEVGPRQEAVAAARDALQGVRQDHAEVERELARIEERQQALRAEADRWAADQAARSERRSEQDAELLALGEARARAAGDVQEAQQAEAEAHTALQAARDDEQRAARAHAAAEGEGGALRERLDAQQARVAELVSRRQQADERGVQQAERARDLVHRAEEAGKAAAEATERRARITEERAASYDRLERERARVQELKRGLVEAEEDRANLQERHRDASALVQRLTEQAASVRAEIDAVRTRLDDRYQVSLPGLLDRLERSGRLDLVADPEVARGLSVGAKTIEGVEPLVVRPAMLEDEDAVRQALGELDADRASLGRLGEVHLGATAEYEELATRHGELTAQREDLEASVQRLRAAIAKMNRTCRQRFREAFDRVNDNFQVSYPQLLGGGSARLALTDDEDLLETGVEIYVQPPGKRLQSLSLLSGGEKAMTAIALLIALFRVRPSPFCVLDEVDAPLDERNGGRFNGMLRELARSSQFVVITHNRKTMECADTLYGVSMTRPGVSSLVSVALG